MYCLDLRHWPDRKERPQDQAHDCTFYPLAVFSPALERFSLAQPSLRTDSLCLDCCEMECYVDLSVQEYSLV